MTFTKLFTLCKKLVLFFCLIVFIHPQQQLCHLKPLVTYLAPAQQITQPAVETFQESPAPVTSPVQDTVLSSAVMLKHGLGIILPLEVHRKPKGEVLSSLLLGNLAVLQDLDLDLVKG